ncbi:hypothetical protein TKK_0013389 [Trichogramma kaykai]|uniref:RGS domain-containing protein n=1 Tax=Trichogramma kaykai TaxID=54128 RepID=A0ABD2WHP8_9HYME
MLQFFKKAGVKDKLKLSHNSPAKSTSPVESTRDEFVGSPTGVKSNSLCSFQEEEEEDVFTSNKNQINCFRSSLSKTLPEILADKSALGYFIQFMEAQKQDALIKFLIEIECLHSAYSIQAFTIIEENSNKESKESKCDSAINDNHSCKAMSKDSEDKELPDLSLSDCINNAKHNFMENQMSKEESNFNLPKNNPIVNNESKNNCNHSSCKCSSMYVDSARIYRKYIINNFFGVDCLSEDLIKNLETAISSKDSKLIVKYLTDIQRTVYTILNDEYVNEFLKSEFHCKHQIDVLTSGNVLLDDILYNETAFFYFMEFMELENKRELLDFWMTVISYKQNSEDRETQVDPTVAQSDALIIYNKYFSLQAKVPLGFSDRVRFEVEQNICREDGKAPQTDCFDRPCQLVYNFLKRHYLPTFLQSQLFYKYLSELINSAHNSHCIPVHNSLGRTESECSSEISSISNLTSPTKESKQNKKSKYDTSLNGGMNIDSKQLNDPDSLWKRSKSSLSVGYVDNLGRFVTEIEPDPYRKNDKQSRISRAVKRLVNIEQDEVKEESAWKIAEMIVRDVTSLTLGSNDLSPL